MKVTTTAEHTTFDFEEPNGSRHCGSCSLCCRLLPMTGLMADGSQLRKGSNTRCVFQRHRDKGCCSIYQDRPIDCRLYSCRWLASPEETAGMRRPDRAHYVLDPMPDQGRIGREDGTEELFSVAQVWVDPAHPEAAHDPALRAWMLRMASDLSWPTVLRWSSRKATTVFAPPLSHDGKWHYVDSECQEDFGTFSRIPDALKPPA